MRSATVHTWGGSVAHSDFMQWARQPEPFLLGETRTIFGHPASTEVVHAFHRVYVEHVIGFKDEKLLRGWVVSRKIATPLPDEISAATLERIIGAALTVAKRVARARQEAQLEKVKKVKHFAHPFDANRENVMTAAYLRRQSKGHKR